MAIDGVPWTLTALLALSLPPALLLLLAKRSKRSENYRSSHRSSMRAERAGQRDILMRMSTSAIPRMQATRSSGKRKTLVDSLCRNAHTRLGSAAAKFFLFACTAAVMIPDDVRAFLGAGCILTVRKLPALTLSHMNSNSRSRWEQVVLKPGGAGRRWVVGSWVDC